MTANGYLGPPARRLVRRLDDEITLDLGKFARPAKRLVHVNTAGLQTNRPLGNVLGKIDSPVLRNDQTEY